MILLQLQNPNAETMHNKVHTIHHLVIEQVFQSFQPLLRPLYLRPPALPHFANLLPVCFRHPVVILVLVHGDQIINQIVVADTVHNSSRGFGGKEEEAGDGEEE